VYRRHGVALKPPTGPARSTSKKSLNRLACAGFLDRLRVAVLRLAQTGPFVPLPTPSFFFLPSLGFTSFVTFPRLRAPKFCNAVGGARVPLATTPAVPGGLIISSYRANHRALFCAKTVNTTATAPPPAHLCSFLVGGFFSQRPQSNPPAPRKHGMWFFFFFLYPPHGHPTVLDQTIRDASFMRACWGRILHWARQKVRRAGDFPGPRFRA